MSICVVADKCVGCKLCVPACPLGAISVTEKLARIDLSKCNLCGLCVSACEKFDAIEIVRSQNPVVDKSTHTGVWVFAERTDGKVAPVTLELLGEGQRLAGQLKEPLCAVVLTDHMEDGAADLIAFGADKVYLARSPQLNTFFEDAYTEVLVGLIAEHRPNIVLLGATAIGRSLAPRLACRLGTGLTADCTALDIDPATRNLVQTRPAFGGSVIATILCPNHRPQMATVRPRVFKAPRRNDHRTGSIIRFDYSQHELTQRAELLDMIKDVEETAHLVNADIIVSGGLGLGGAENFAVLHDLAKVMGAAVGASRAAVDAGWISYAHQVGQTGRTVRPKLYIACGISGAIQHLVGMQSADTIVAVNTNPQAPIFRVADYGIVGDVLKVIPALTRELRTMRTEGRSDCAADALQIMGQA